ncbi:MAG: hypothetical protein ABSF56_03550 [Minisyncoccia bacterium]|jgi:hypothetical protein
MSTKRIITDGSQFPVQPCDIHIGEGFRRFWDAFGNAETEISAYYVVRLCQKLGGWIPFTRDEIESVYREAGHHDGFRFNQLVDQGENVLNGPAVLLGAMPETEPVGGGWIVLGTDDKYRVTDDFVMRCFRTSPASKTLGMAATLV